MANIAEKFGQDVVNQITQIFDFGQNLTWFNKNTNRTLTNYQYNMLVINEAFNDRQENKGINMNTEEKVNEKLKE